MASAAGPVGGLREKDEIVEVEMEILEPPERAAERSVEMKRVRNSANGKGSHVCSKRRKKNMRDDQRFGAYFALEALRKAREVLPADHAADKALVAELLHTSVRTVERIWKEACEQVLRGEEVDVSNKKKGRSGRKRKS